MNANNNHKQDRFKINENTLWTEESRHTKY